MQISVFVPQYGVIEAITPAFRTFNTANDFLTAFGKKPIFNVEYVGLNEYVPANNGEYTIRTHRLLRDVAQTDLLIIPPTFGDTNAGILANAEAIPCFKRLHKNGSSLASLCIGAFLLAETGLLDGKKCSTHWAHITEFKEKYPQIEVEDGAVITQHDNIYSSGGASSLWNLILYLVEKFSDRETACKLPRNCKLPRSFYFSRSNFDVYTELEDFQGDELFSTSHDYKISKILANEQFQDFLMMKYKGVDGDCIQNSDSPVVWTGNQTDLIELLYALVESGCLNNGNIQIKSAILYFQSIFQVDLKYYYHKYTDITNRKKERTVFLDRLKEGLTKKMDSKHDLHDPVLKRIRFS